MSACLSMSHSVCVSVCVTVPLSLPPFLSPLFLSYYSISANNDIYPDLFLYVFQDSTDYDNWESRYVLLLWLCILCLIPFDICSMDSTLHTFTTTDALPGSGDEKRSVLVLEIIEISKKYLSDPGPIRESASACLSSLLTRPDMENLLLAHFFSYSCQTLSNWTNKGNEVMTELTSNSFHVIGVLQTIAQIFKKGVRSKLLSHSNELLSQCLAISLQSNQVKIRKLTVKLIQRIGMTFLPPRVALWRYQRGKRSLSDNLTQSMCKEVRAECVTAKFDSEIKDVEEAERRKEDEVTDHDVVENEKKVSREKEKENEKKEEVEGDDDGEDFEVDPELEDVIDKVLTALSDKDTIVRWSGAKGVGRITMRLPKSYGNDVVGAVLGKLSSPYLNPSQLILY